jgi:hypothetical protein
VKRGARARAATRPAPFTLGGPPTPITAGHRYSEYFDEQRKRWEVSGYRPALLQTAVFCEDNDLPVPPWARKALAAAFAQHLGRFDPVTKAWEPETTGRVLARRDAPGARRRPSLDSLLGIQGKGGHRSQPERWFVESEIANDLRQVAYIQQDHLKTTGRKMTQRAAAFFLAKRRGKSDADAEKFFEAFKQRKHNAKSR